jgi:hypothetical protein
MKPCQQRPRQTFKRTGCPILNSFPSPTRNHASPVPLLGSPPKPPNSAPRARSSRTVASMSSSSRPIVCVCRIALLPRRRLRHYESPLARSEPQSDQQTIPLSRKEDTGVAQNALWSTHVPGKWKPIRRQEDAPLTNSQSVFRSLGTGRALVAFAFRETSGWQLNITGFDLPARLQWRP